MNTRCLILVLMSVSVLFAAMDPDDSLYVRTLLDENGLTDVKVSDVVNYDMESGRVFSLILSNVYTIYGKKVTRLPDDIDRLDTLLYLMVNDASLETLPDAIGNLAYLKNIEAQRNRLKLLPESIGDCPRLEYINVSNNELKTLPAGIGRCPSLYVLNVSNNLLVSLPEEITQQTFNGNYYPAYFEGNYLCNLTGTVGEWFAEHFSDSKQNCELNDQDMKIVEAILDEAGLGELFPEMVATFRQGRVITLDLSYRNLSVLPASVSRLAVLEKLNLENNSLTDLPADLAELGSLTEINVSRNRMQQIPQVVPMCKKLELLLIDYNDLTDLPLSLMSVPRVSCRFNRLCGISDTLDRWLEKMDGGVYRHCQDCPIPESGHPMLTIGNSWEYTIIQVSADREKTDSLVREIVIKEITAGRDTVVTLERDSGMMYDNASNTFVPVDTTVARTYCYSYQRLVPVENSVKRMEDISLLINSDWNPEEPKYSVDTLKVFAEETYFYTEDSAAAIKHLCLNENIGLLGGDLQGKNGVNYQIYLCSFNGKTFDSGTFRQQVNKVSDITPVLYRKQVRREKQLLFAGSAVQRFDLLGRKQGTLAPCRRGTAYGMIVESDNGCSRSVLRLR